MQSSLFTQLNDALLPVTGFGLAFRSVALSDTGPLFDATRDARFNEYLLWPQPSDREEVMQRVRRLRQASDAGQICAFSVVDEFDGSWVSLFRIVPWHDDPSGVEIGVWTHPRMWAARLSTGIVRLAFDVAFARTPVSKIHGACNSSNRASIQLMTNSGMSPIGLSETVRSSEDSLAFPTVTMAITRQQWAEQREQPLFVDWAERCDLQEAARTPSQIGRQAIERMRASDGLRAAHAAAQTSGAAAQTSAAAAQTSGAAARAA